MAQEEVTIDDSCKSFVTVRIIEKDSQDLFKEVKIEIQAMSQYSKYIVSP